MSGRLSVDSVSVARAVKAAVEAVPGVVGISPGRFARIGTYGRDTVVQGVAVSQSNGGVTFEIHIVASSSVESLPDLAESVRRAARQSASNLGIATVRQIDVTIADLRDEESPR